MSLNNICRALLITSIVSASSVDYGLASNSNKKQEKAIQKKVGQIMKGQSSVKKQQAKDDEKKRKEEVKEAKRAKKEEAKKQKEEAKRQKEKEKKAKKTAKENEKIEAKQNEEQSRNEYKNAATAAVNKAKQCILERALVGSINLQAIDEFYINVSSLLIKAKTLRDREDLYTQADYEKANSSIVKEAEKLLDANNLTTLLAHSGLTEYIAVVSKLLTTHDRPSLSGVSDILSQLKRYLNKYVSTVTKEIKVQKSALMDDIIGNDEIWDNDTVIEEKVTETIGKIKDNLNIQDDTIHQDSDNTESSKARTNVVADEDGHQPTYEADIDELPRENEND